MQNQPVDLILLDINLPDENGLMLTRALRERSTVDVYKRQAVYWAGGRIYPWHDPAIIDSRRINCRLSAVWRDDQRFRCV